AEATLVSSSNPSDSLDLLAMRNALGMLPVDQREALILVGAGGLAYEEAAEICGVAVGTIKSRVSRARKAVVEILDSNGAGYSDDSGMKAEDAFNDIMRQADDIAGAR
ncbi:MAG: sigma factor-like helix-turn-helix DNA-binding protein, partial [Hyphomonas sp.]|nr:sigma factor-like helix-turn-helix DNA-binding protein [Hyphomonas sp.]